MIAQPQICIIDYDVGNVASVFNALNYLGYKHINISSHSKVIQQSDVIILPGVGAFSKAMSSLKSKKLDIILGEQVLEKKVPILGICVGMQLMASRSEENGVHHGLNWIPGDIKKMQPASKIRVPHVGWNEVFVKTKSSIYGLNRDQANFYFDHSYQFKCDDEYITGYCEYGMQITASVQRDNIHGVQFHPEKSHISGLKLFRAFLNSV